MHPDPNGDGSNLATCDACGQAIRWTRTVERRTFLAVDVQPVQNGGHVIVSTQGEPHRSKRIGGNRPFPEEPFVGYTEHAKTCKAAGRRHLQLVASVEPSTRNSSHVRCRGCLNPLDAELLRLEPHHRTHPSCEPVMSS